MSPSWFDAIKSSLTSQTATWLVALFIGILTIFSSYFTEKIKFALNRADLRSHQFEELASEVSQYIFSAELIVEFIENDWTTKKSMSDLVTEYNQSITALRKKEFVYLAWIQKFWGERQLNLYNNFMLSVRSFDSAIHSINDELEAVNITGTKQKIDRKRAEEALKLMKPSVENLRKNGTLLLTSLT